MTAPTVFISYSSKNKDWVKNWLLPKIESKGIKTRIDFRDFEIGTPSLINMERAVDECAKTILVFTPDWVNSEWTQFEGLMLMVQDPIGMRKKIMPLMLVNCDLPTRLKIFTYADFREEEDWDLQFERIISQIKKDFATLAPPPLQYPPLLEEKIDITRFPQTAFNLFGRQNELNQLDQAWESAETNVICFVAYGGVGKTTLVNKWVEKMRWDNYRGAKRVYAWSFYSQGTGDRVSSADIFIAEALKWFGDPTMANSNASPWDKGQRLAELVRQEKTLLLLDGMEPLQSYLAVERGKVKDPALQVLITELARDNPGLCVITTRENVVDLGDFPHTTLQVDLEQISAEAGRALLQIERVQGSEEELEQTSRNFGLHALALNLLGAYLHEIPGHHISHASEIPDIDVPLEKGKHPRRVMAAFAKRFGASAEVEVIHILGLFDSSADKEEVTAVRESPAIPGLTDHIEKLSDVEWMQVINRLRHVKLIAPESSHHPNTLDCHPLLREHFGEKLIAENIKAWQEAHGRLYEYYKSAAKEFPDTLDEMAPLFAAVMHGCHAKRHQDVFDGVYWKRIQRDKNHFITKRLAAYSADLSAISNFFDAPYYRPVNTLDKNGIGFVLNQAGVDLRALGRLKDAIDPLQASLTIYRNQKEWTFASAAAYNLSGIFLLIGEIAQAMNYGKQCVELAYRESNFFSQMTAQVGLADIYHYAGEFAKAEEEFKIAEKIQKSRQPVYPLLYGGQGYKYCDLLLSQKNMAMYNAAQIKH